MEKYYFRADAMGVGYGKSPLLKPVWFGLERGQILTVIGPNGAGKSTILKSIAGQLRLLGGMVYLGEEAFLEMSGAERSRRMAVVFTERPQAAYMTCQEVVEAGRYPYTGRLGLLRAEDRAAVEAAMEAVRIAGLRNQEFGTLSDGQRQRVLLARALCQEPEILVLDEPTSYLDIRYKLEFMASLQEMTRKKGLTVVMSLHELDLAARVSDRILCVDGEQADRFGPPEEVFSGGYIAGLFGLPAGYFEEESGSLELPAPAGEPQIFVIGGNGSGTPVFRRLQREGIPFAAGILFENDRDFRTAQALAARVVAAPAFEPMGADQAACAREILDGCRSVICCREKFGTLERENEALLAYARAQGKPVELPYARARGKLV